MGVDSGPSHSSLVEDLVEELCVVHRGFGLPWSLGSRQHIKEETLVRGHEGGLYGLAPGSAESLAPTFQKSVSRPQKLGKGNMHREGSESGGDQPVCHGARKVSYHASSVIFLPVA